MKKFSFLFLGLVLLVLFTFSYYVWPTKYEYKDVKVGNFNYTIRINRFTNKVEKQQNDRWVLISMPQKIPEDVLKEIKITVNENFDKGIFDIYNGSCDWVINELIVEVAVIKKWDKEGKRLWEQIAFKKLDFAELNDYQKKLVLEYGIDTGKIDTKNLTDKAWQLLRQKPDYALKKVNRIIEKRKYKLSPSQEITPYKAQKVKIDLGFFLEDYQGLEMINIVEAKGFKILN